MRQPFGLNCAPENYLLEAGADLNIRDDKYRATALGWADFFGRSDLADLIRDRGGSI